MQPKKLDASRDSLRKINRGTVLRLIATGQCYSRIDLSKRMGLTKTAISNIVSELMERNFLMQTEKKENAELGRNPIGLDFSPQAPKIAGLLIMRSFCEAVLCDFKLHVLKRERINRVCETEAELQKTIFSLTDQILYQQENVGAIGVACIGPLDSKLGRIGHPPFFHGIHDVEVQKLLQERYHLPVFCDNDNQSAALAERLYGNGKNHEDILLVGLSEGVGCGIIIAGKPYQAFSGYTPEIGHMSIDYRGPICVCGNRGCLELYVNSASVLQRMQAATGKYYNYKTFCELSDQPEIDEILLDLTQKLRPALVSVVNILNPGLIILGHDGVYWPDKYLKILEDEINAYKFSSKDEKISVKKAFLGEKTGILGAACNAIEHYFSGEML